VTDAAARHSADVIDAWWIAAAVRKRRREQALDAI